ncbi:GNAT family N-acetyltransferase [Lentzea indica]|uniref:GNAT family N-acetyltransferase n=1 Tax=Lentzea indica TaxID=2604800 RepID=UPI001CB7251B|nr:hypothetical protein [Lentzea indica]
MISTDRLDLLPLRVEHAQEMSAVLADPALHTFTGGTPPKTREEWLAATAKLDQGDQQGIYLPGQNWYTLSGFVWDEGGASPRRTATGGRAR